MKKQLIATLLYSVCITSNTVFAAQPTNINYAGKDSTFGGERYRLYTVRCSDGKKRTITQWKKNAWCVGKGSKKGCRKSQMSSAKRACK